MFDIMLLGAAVQTAAARTGWEGWPFSGVGSPWLAGALRLGFVALLFVGLAWFLRWLYGPGGLLRPAEFGTEHIARRKENKARAAELRVRWKAGELDDDAYDEALKELYRES